MAKDVSANLYIATPTTPPGAPFSFFLIKYNSGGTQQWHTTYSNGNITSIVSIGADNAQNCYVLINSKTGADVMKFGSAGQLLSISPVIHNNGQPWVSAMKVDAAGNCYITGYTVTASPQTLTFKMNSTGVLQWGASYVGPGSTAEAGEAITTDPAGNVYVSSNSGGAIATLKYDGNGNFLWAGRYSGPSATQNMAGGIAEDSVSGNVYTVGTTETGFLSALGDVIGYSSGGIQLWANQDVNAMANIDVLVDYAGNVITLGMPPSNQVFTATKYTSAGSVQWTIGNSPFEGLTGQSFASVLDNSGNLYITLPTGSTEHYATMEYYSDGTLAWTLNYTAPVGLLIPSTIALQNPIRRGIDFIQFPDVFVTGITVNSDNIYSLTTVMYSRPSIFLLSSTADSLNGNGATLASPAARVSNYPNPFHGATTISYTIANDSHVTLQIYDGGGRTVATLVDEEETAGAHTIPFNAQRLATGIYTYRIVALSPQGTFTQSKQMIIQ